MRINNRLGIVNDWIKRGFWVRQFPKVMKEFTRVILIHKAEVTLVRQFGGMNEAAKLRFKLV